MQKKRSLLRNVENQLLKVKWSKMKEGLLSSNPSSADRTVQIPNLFLMDLKRLAALSTPNNLIIV
jgi:hypothetical protein